MRLIGTFYMLVFAGILSAQLQPDIVSQPGSSDWTERSAAYRRLASDPNPSVYEESALVALLAYESASLRQSIVGHRDYKGEGYSEYIARLLDSVVKIADKEPGRADVWPALITCDHSGDSAFGRWVAAHADKAVPFIKACAREAEELFKGQALTSLAQVVAYERDPSTAHHLDSAEVDSLEATVRSGLHDDSVFVRMEAVTSLAIMGNKDDVRVLRADRGDGSRLRSPDCRCWPPVQPVSSALHSDARDKTATGQT